MSGSSSPPSQRSSSSTDDRMSQSGPLKLSWSKETLERGIDVVKQKISKRVGRKRSNSVESKKKRMSSRSRSREKQRKMELAKRNEKVLQRAQLAARKAVIRSSSSKNLLTKKTRKTSISANGGGKQTSTRLSSSSTTNASTSTTNKSSTSKRASVENSSSNKRGSSSIKSKRTLSKTGTSTLSSSSKRLGSASKAKTNGSQRSVRGTIGTKRESKGKSKPLSAASSSSSSSLSKSTSLTKSSSRLSGSKSTSKSKKKKKEKGTVTESDGKKAQVASGEKESSNHSTADSDENEQKKSQRTSLVPSFSSTDMEKAISLNSAGQRQSKSHRAGKVGALQSNKTASGESTSSGNGGNDRPHTAKQTNHRPRKNIHRNGGLNGTVDGSFRPSESDIEDLQTYLLRKSITGDMNMMTSEMDLPSWLKVQNLQGLNAPLASIGVTTLDGLRSINPEQLLEAKLEEEVLITDILAAADLLRAFEELDLTGDSLASDMGGNIDPGSLNLEFPEDSLYELVDKWSTYDELLLRDRKIIGYTSRNTMICANRNILEVLDLETGLPFFSQPIENDVVDTVWANADTVLVGLLSGNLIGYSTQHITHPLPVKAHDARVTCIAEWPSDSRSGSASDDDGNYLRVLSAGEDRMVHLWDVHHSFQQPLHKEKMKLAEVVRRILPLSKVSPTLCAFLHLSSMSFFLVLFCFVCFIYLFVSVLCSVLLAVLRNLSTSLIRTFWFLDTFPTDILSHLPFSPSAPYYPPSRTDFHIRLRIHVRPVANVLPSEAPEE